MDKCPKCGGILLGEKEVGIPGQCRCVRETEKLMDRRSAAACSRSLDVFESWEQFCRVKITGYTLRDGTDVCRFNFPSGKPNARTTDHMTLLIKQGWQITAIHYENAGAMARGLAAQELETTTEIDG